MIPLQDQYFLPLNSCSENQSRMMLIESVVDRWLEITLMPSGGREWLREGLQIWSTLIKSHSSIYLMIPVPAEKPVFSMIWASIILVMRSDRGLLINKPMNHPPALWSPSLDISMGPTAELRTMRSPVGLWLISQRLHETNNHGLASRHDKENGETRPWKT